MAVAHVQHDWDFKQDAASTTHVYASGLTVATGNLMAVMIKYAGNAALTAVVTDNKGNTYTQTPGGYVDGSDDGAGLDRAAAFYARNITGGTLYTLTITYSDTVGGAGSFLVFHEISGADPTAPLVGNVGNAQAAPGTGANAITSTAITPSASNAYVFGAFAASLVGVTTAVGTGFTAGVSDGLHPSNYNITSEYLIQGAAASVAATFTANAAVANTITMLMAFQPPSAGPAQARRTMNQFSRRRF